MISAHNLLRLILNNRTIYFLSPLQSTRSNLFSFNNFQHAVRGRLLVVVKRRETNPRAPDRELPVLNA